jgi:hypothetical protein
MLADTGEDIWTDDEIDDAVTKALFRVSRVRPRIAKETVTATASKVVDLSDIASIASVLAIRYIEYPVDEDPVKYRNFTYDLDLQTALMDIETTPTAGDDIYVYCEYVHTADTCPTDLAEVVADLAAAYAAQSKPLTYWNTLASESHFTSLDTAVATIGTRLTQAVADLTSSRGQIGDNLASATTAVGTVAARVTQSIADLASGRALVGSKRTEAITAIEAMATQLAAAIVNLGTGEALIGDQRTDAIGVVDSMDTAITQARTDLASARTYFNKINTGDPEYEYLRAATGELSAAGALLNQARGYLSDNAAPGVYRQQAVAEMQSAQGYLNQARGYLLLDQDVAMHQRDAAGELQAANMKLAEARAYLNLDQQSVMYRQQAAGELGAVGGYLAQCRTYLDRFKSKVLALQITDRYLPWGQQREARAEAMLRLYIPAVKKFRRYPRD